jgi:hypothetical protein
MHEGTHQPQVSILQETMLLRLQQSEDLRDFAIQMWLQNPPLARQAGARVMELLLPLGASSLIPRRWTR